MVWRRRFVRFFVAFPVAAVLVDSIAGIASVHGTSMQPTLNPRLNAQRDVVWLNKWSMLTSEPERGDIVVYKSPIDPAVSNIKRVIGLPGDVVKTRNYKVDVITVPKGHCWVEGDNHETSSDSNTHGPLALGLIYAKVTHIVWPLKRRRKLRQFVPDDRECLLTL